MPLPPQEGKGRGMRVDNNCQLGVLEGCLFMSSSPKPIYDIWIMKDYNIHGCWTKLFRIMSNMGWTALTLLFHSRSDHKVLLLSESRPVSAGII
ncbi:hypothetical protein SLEP1_g22111 [Rubroshorea leprosula]|uniref:F-box associated domain-containing protein n=1 Tax=Rubroshorea leprosula TaxID=152421 RepID=A0AAV5JE59_9ROSI|nr:hypothetical protein SLEP1_g22111 [Rubroshorea leprosula]